jgi:hypothetical protein
MDSNNLYFKDFKRRNLFAVLVTFFVFLLIVMQSSSAFLPEDNPTSSVGIDFIVPLEQEPVYLVALYNSTRVEFDYNGDGLVDDSINLSNKGDTYNKTDLPASSHIHANKPILATQRKEWNSECKCGGNLGIWGYSWGFSLPKTSELATEYYVAHPYSEIYITAAYSNTTLQIDKGNDGSWDVSQTLPPGTVYNDTSLLPGDKISATMPVVVVQRGEKWNSVCGACGRGYGIWGYSWGFLLSTPSKDYFVPLEKKSVYILSLNNLTRIEFDYNGDGISDDNVTLNKSETLNRTDLPTSTHIHANKEILVMQRGEKWNSACLKCGYVMETALKGYSWGFILPKASELGTEYYVANPSNTIHITATYSNTTIKIDERNDGTFEITQNLPPGVLYNNSNLSAGDRILANKPIILTQEAPVWDSECSYCNNHGRWSYSWAFLLKSSSLETTQEMPGRVELGGIFSLTTKVINPTRTLVNNIKVNLTYPSAFSLASNVTVTKYNLTTDAIISGPENVTFSPTCNADDCIGTINQSQLGANEYLALVYKLQAPSSPAVYSFRQVETSYTAETWLWGF